MIDPLQLEKEMLADKAERRYLKQLAKNAIPPEHKRLVKLMREISKLNHGTKLAIYTPEEMEILNECKRLQVNQGLHLTKSMQALKDIAIQFVHKYPERLEQLELLEHATDTLDRVILNLEYCVNQVPVCTLRTIFTEDEIEDLKAVKHELVSEIDEPLERLTALYEKYQNFTNGKRQKLKRSQLERLQIILSA